MVDNGSAGDGMSGSWLQFIQYVETRAGVDNYSYDSDAGILALTRWGEYEFDEPWRIRLSEQSLAEWLATDEREIRSFFDEPKSPWDFIKTRMEIATGYPPETGPFYVQGGVIFQENADREF